MLFYQTLERLCLRVEKSVDALFDLAYINQTHPQDLLLILENGFYHSTIQIGKEQGLHNLSPYTIGPGEIGLAENTQYQFYDNYRRNTVNKADFILKVHEDESIQKLEEMSIHLELFVFLKFWEADRIIKMLFMLTQLIKKRPFDWHFVIEKHEGTGKNKNRKGIPFIVTHEVRDQLYDSGCPIFAFLLECIYDENLRNAAAHSQYAFLGRYIHIYKYDKKQQEYLLSVISYERWEEHIHLTILLYNILLKNIDKYNTLYKEKALGKHYGLPLRITTPEGKEQIENYCFNGQRWIWYKNTPQARR